jgi:hypothetical protein
MQGSIVVMERGTCTFAQKILRAQASGAIGVIIVQTFDVWPYTMTDSKGESASITIPAFMLSMKQGKRSVADACRLEVLRLLISSTVCLY